MPKRKRARQSKKQEVDEEVNVDKEIEQIKNPLESLFKVANIKVRNDEKIEEKKQDAKIVKVESKYKKMTFGDEEADVLKHHFDKDSFINVQKNKVKKLKV